MSINWREEIAEIKRFMDDNVCKLGRLAELCEEFGINPNALRNRFKVAYSINPQKYLDNIKIGKLKQLLHDSDSIEIAFFYADALGFKSEAGLYHLLRRATGLTFGKFVQEYGRVLDR